MLSMCWSVLIAVAAAQGEAEEAVPSPPPAATPQAKKPIISTDIFHGTAELFYDVYDAVHGTYLKPHIDKHADTVSKTVASVTDVDVVGEACKVLTCDAKEVNEQVRTAAGTAQGHAKEAHRVMWSVLEKVEALLNQYTNTMVDLFESALPKYKGVIGRTPLNFLLFVLYIFSVMYFMMKLFFWSIWLAKSILCCLCCCGCCCLRKKASQVGDKGAKNGKASKAAEKGKAATAPPANSKAQAKAKK